MLNVELDENTGILYLEPDGKLTEEDFVNAAKIADEYLESYESLNGLVIHTQNFPGWDSFSALVKHLEFIRDHHKKISRTAIVTDSFIGDFGEKIASHFINAEVKHFPYSEMSQAVDWIKS